MDRVFAGIRATGRLHLGNYLGSIKGMIDLVNQGSYDCLFQVVDLHTITTPYDPETLQSSVHNIVLDYLAAGLPVDRCHLAVQSEVPEHVILSYLFATIYSVNKLEDLPTYKEKKAQHRDYNNLGLLYYPILMAADILLYKAVKVPAGLDQEPHLEVAREVARKFNSIFGKTFPEPQRFVTPGGYVPSLKGVGKMSKSIEGSYLNLTDDKETIRKKLAGLPTDSGKNKGQEPDKNLSAIFDLIRLFSQEKYESYKSDYLKGEISYFQMKNDLADLIDQELAPIRARRKEFEGKPKEVLKILAEGREYCRNLAKATLSEVKEKMGLLRE